MKHDAQPADIETSSDNYAARFAGPVGDWMLKRQANIVTRMLAPHPNATVLDVGGGHGQLAHPLTRRGYRPTVLGSDASCRTRLTPLLDNGTCTFEEGDLLDPPFDDKTFDVVLSFRLLPHCDAWRVLVQQLCRIAKQAVIVDYPTSQSLNCIAPALFGAKKKLEGNTRPFTLFTHDEVKKAFETCAFAPSQRVGEFFLPMVFHRALRCRPLSAALEAACRGLGLVRLWGSPVISHFTPINP